MIGKLILANIRYLPSATSDCPEVCVAEHGMLTCSLPGAGVFSNRYQSTFVHVSLVKNTRATANSVCTSSTNDDEQMNTKDNEMNYHSW